MTIMIATQHTSAPMYASSLTNTMDYPHLLATCRKYLDRIAISGANYLPQSWPQWEAHVRTRHCPTSELRADDPFSCGEMPHQCGQLCALDSREGCLHRCCKVGGTSPSQRDSLTHFQPIYHDDDEGHMCAARTHACGAPCGLQVDGKPLCTRKCVADWQVSEIAVKL